jgi:hypothetical protein
VGIDRSDDLECGELARAEDVDSVRRNRDALDQAADRSEYFDSLREAAWREAVDRFRAGWAAHRERWPDEERESVDRSADPPGSWRGSSNRFLDTAANAEVDARYEQIAEVERTRVSPAMREIESCDPSRSLVGLEHRLKSPDRLKDKIVEGLDERGRTVETATALVPDALRYTFQYDEARYIEGARTDIARLKEHGFELVRLKNY